MHREPYYQVVMSKRNIILSAVACIILAICMGAGALLALVIFAVLYGISVWSHRDIKHREEPKSLEQIVEEYGEPDDSIIINPTRANDPVGIILVYSDKGFIVTDGMRLDIKDITSVAAKNSATPYTLGEFQIVITTVLKGRKSIRLNAGYDFFFADNAAADLRRYVKS